MSLFLAMQGFSKNQLSNSGELVTNLKAHECEFFIAGAKGPVRDVFNVSGFYKFLGEDHFFKTISQAVDEVNSLNSI